MVLYQRYNKYVGRKFGNGLGTYLIKDCRKYLGKWAFLGINIKNRFPKLFYSKQLINDKFTVWIKE